MIAGTSRASAKSPGCRFSDRLTGLFLVFSLALGLVSCKPDSENNLAPGLTPVGRVGPVVLKVITSQPGVVEIDRGNLTQSGIELDAVSQPVHLYWRGLSLPVWIDSDPGRLRFFAQASQSVYSQENIYWLVQGDESLPPNEAYWKMQEELPASAPVKPAQSLVDQGAFPAGTYAVAIRLEENRQYFPQLEQGDHWLWASLAAPQTQDYEVSLAEVEPLPGAIRVAVWARTEGPGEVDHHLRISINGSQVADYSWDGKGRQEIVAAVPAGVWKNGSNTIQLDAPGDTGNLADVVLLDWIEVVSGQKFQAQDDRLYFHGSGVSQPIQGFSGPVQAYDVTDPLHPAELEPPLSIGDAFTGEPEHAYWLVGATGGYAPDRITPADESMNLRAADAGADYIAIGPPDLLAPLQPLLEYHRQEGLKVVAVPLQSVFDQFSGGLPEPEAIRAFLRYASHSWQLKPRFLLLVGDASYDPLGFQAPAEANRLPVFLVDTAFGGETGSDIPFTQLDDDLLPDLAVGRIPARYPAQVTVVVDKTLSYVQQPADAGWKQRVLAVADGQDGAFRFDAQRFLDLFPGTIQTEILAPAAGETAVSRQIIERLDQGDGLVAYFGHGSLNMWGKDRLFSTEDVPNLQNTDRYPIMIHLTCLTGLFTHPQMESLAETLLWQPSSGAVAVLAPTSLTLPGDQSFLSQPLVESLLDQTGVTLGEALLHARRNISPENPGQLDVMETFLLFGDPALRVSFQ